ncbi:MAG: hypothetical protein AAFV27_02315 [Pseudomonadota bacterium]
MCDRAYKPNGLVSRFIANQNGSASTEWVVAVAVVVLMAVPVMALIGEGTERNSESVVISIQDADSFGGEGFHGDDGNLVAFNPADLDEADFNPGEDLGVGFPDETQIAASPNGDEDRPAVGRPRFYSNADSGLRRDKPSSVAARRDRDPLVVQGSNLGEPDIRLPSASGGREAVATLGANHCLVEDIAKTAKIADASAQGDATVVASGR